MLTTVLIMGIAVIFEPVRIGLAVLMLNRPRPMLQLLALLCGGLTMGVGVGLTVLFILRATPLAGADGFTVPNVQIAIGLLVLLVAVVLATDISARQFTRGPFTRAAVGGDSGVGAIEPTPPSGLEKLSTHARNLLQGSSLWVAGVSGLGTALPSANYMAAMAVILASGAAPAAQAGALLTFNVVAFTLVEVPLVSYLVAPDKTRAAMAALHSWIRSRRRRDVAAVVAAGGCFMLALGMSGL
jgi:Sap, sulfolipid-1-addressing protein